MTSANAPYPYFNGIKYNKLFFSATTSGLTQAQANTLYLQKTVPDSAIALETFSNGLLTSSVESLTALTPVTMGTNTSLGVNIGRAGANNTITGLTTFLNGTFDINGAIDVPTSLTSLPICPNSNGTITIGTNATRTAAITIGANTSPITLNGSGVTCSGGLTIGGSNNITLGNGTVAPTSTQLGYKLPITVVANSYLAGVQTTIRSASVPPGVWSIQGYAYYDTPGQYAQLSISTTSGSFGAPYITQYFPGSAISVQVCNIVSLTTTTSYYLVASGQTGANVSSVIFNIFRIA